MKEKSSSLESTSADLSTEDARHSAMVMAVDYRGDITLCTKQGQRLIGYIYDYAPGPSPDPGDAPGTTPSPGTDSADAGQIRLMCADDGRRVTLACGDITQLCFTGKDTAAGKSWETWVAHHQEKKARGEKANILPEPLE